MALFKVEALLDGTEPIGGTWTDITSKVLVSRGCSWKRGITGLTAADRCASAGSFTFTLRSNPTGTYVPGHANCTANWGFGTWVRVTLNDGTNTRIAFYGRVREIVPGPGPFASGRMVQVVATDWLDDAAEWVVQGLTPQSYATGDAIITALLACFAEAPATSLDAGVYTFPFALDTVEEGQTRVLQALSQIAQSEHGYVYLSGAGQLRFDSRNARATADVSVLTLDNHMHALTVRHDRAAWIDKAQVTVHPRTVDAAATTVLFRRHDISLAQPALRIEASATTTVFGSYTDPSNGRMRCGGTEMVTPVATTDYTANTLENGTGTNKTSALTVTASYTASGVSLELQNTDTAPIFVTKLQCRGKGVYDYNPIECEQGTGSVAVRLDMPFQPDVNVGGSVAGEVLSIWGQAAVPCEVTFVSWPGTVYQPGDMRLLATVTAEIGDRVTVIEDSTATDGQFHVQSIAQRLGVDNLITTTWGLIPASTSAFWMLGTGELGDTSGSTTTAIGY